MIIALWTGISLQLSAIGRRFKSRNKPFGARHLTPGIQQVRVWLRTPNESYPQADLEQLATRATVWLKLLTTYEGCSCKRCTCNIEKRYVLLLMVRLESTGETHFAFLSLGQHNYVITCTQY